MKARIGDSLRCLVREPMVHFLAIAIVLFSIHALLTAGESGPNERLIHVDEITLASYLQFNGQAFSERHRDNALQRLATMDRDVLDALAWEYAREEALHREALALGLDRSDYVIRRRLVQTLEYLYTGLADIDEAFDDTALRAFYLDHQERYRRGPIASFTHVFIRDRPDGEAQQEAGALLTELVSGDVGFSGATAWGDHFAFHRNYIDVDPDLTASHFGRSLSEVVFAQDTPLDRWFGPVRSPHGWHLVLVLRRDLGGAPPFEAVRGLIVEDYRRERLRIRTEAMIAGTVADYDVRMDLQ